MSKEIIFDRCVEEAIQMGRKHMVMKDLSKIPTKEEWQLALILFQEELR